jgi:hypothetical protein
MVALAETKALWIWQLLTEMVSGAPTLSVNVTVTGDAMLHGAPSSVTPVTPA